MQPPAVARHRAVPVCILGNMFGDAARCCAQQNGGAGTVKMTMPIAWSTGMVAWGMLDFKEGYTKSGELQAG